MTTHSLSPLVAVRFIRPMFDLLGTPDEHKALRVFETDHIPPMNEFIKQSLDWLDRYLGPVEGL